MCRRGAANREMKKHGAEMREKMKVEYGLTEQQEEKAEVEVMKEKNNKKKENINMHLEIAGGKAFVGALLILGAAALIASKLGYLSFAGISFWSIVLTIFFVGTFVEGIARVRVWEVLFSLAFLVIVHDELLGLEAITPWPVLGAALLGTIGVGMLFPKLGRLNKDPFITVNGRPYKKGEGICEETIEGSHVSYENVFSEAVKYVSGEISKVEVENVFGSTQVYFTDAVPVEGRMRVEVENVFGNTTLYVPKEWKVSVRSENVFGGTKEKGRCTPDSENEIRIDVESVFGGVEIRYI